jgi:hypothetical protein
MPRLMFTNPFAKHDVSEYTNVVIPLARARRANSTSSKEKPDDSSRASSDGVQSGRPMTIEDLRAEIDSDIAAGGHDTAYDRELFSELSKSFPLCFFFF